MMKAGVKRKVLALFSASSVAHSHALRGGHEFGEDGNNVTAVDDGGFLPKDMDIEMPCGNSDSCDQQLVMAESSLLSDNNLPPPIMSIDSPKKAPNTLANQIICGYQGWFAYPGDGGPINQWEHWGFQHSANAKTVKAEDLTVDLYPTVDEYDDEDLIETGIPMKEDPSSSSNNSFAKFYSALKPNIVVKHFEWMSTYGITGVFHMRFMEGLQDDKVREWKTTVLRNVKRAAEITGRTFSVSYNIAGHTIDNTVLDDIKIDWMRLVDEENITQSDRYIRQGREEEEGRLLLPVLRIYGIGFKDVRVSDTSGMAELIDWFQNTAEEKYRVFLIGGVPSKWRTLVGDSREESSWKDIYDSLDGIHPWHVGRWRTIEHFDDYYSDTILPDAEYCNGKGILYMPTMWPGFSWYNLQNNRKHKQGETASLLHRLGGFTWRRAIQHMPVLKIGRTIWMSQFGDAAKPEAPINAIPRLGGTFMWRQAFQYAANPNINTIWMAQFDEVDEGTAIFKVAATEDDLPARGSWLSLGDDGQSLPSDWYLRLCGEAQKMLEGKISLNAEIPIQPFPVAGAELQQTER